MEWSDTASLRDLARSLREISAGFTDPRREELQAEHFRLFGPSPECPLEIACHLSDNPIEQAKIMAQISAFHRAFGVEVQDGNRPDNLSVCLEFCSYLLLKVLNALEKNLPEGGEITREAIESYAREYLAPGAAAFLKKLREHSQNSFYTELAEEACHALTSICPAAPSVISRWDRDKENHLAEGEREGSCGLSSL